MVLTIVLVTVCVTFLYVGSGPVMTETPDSTSTMTVYHAKDEDSVLHDGGKILAVTTATTTTVTADTTWTATDVPAGLQWKNVQVPDVQAAGAREPTAGDCSIVGDLQVTSRSGHGPTAHDVAISRSGMPHTVGGDRYSIDDERYRFDFKSDDTEAVDGGTVSKTNVLFDIGSNPKTQNQYSTELANTPVTADKIDYFNANNVDDNGYITKEGFKWITNNQREQINAVQLSPAKATLTGSYGQAPNSFQTRRPIGHEIYYRPSVTVPGKAYQPSYAPDEDNHQLRSPQSSRYKINWQNIGVLALIKFILLKLQTIGLLQYVFILVFKLKLFIIAVFFKFVLLLKFMAFFKILILPLFFWSFLPILTPRFSRPNNMQSTNASATQSSFGSLSNAFSDSGSQASGSSQSSSFASGFFSSLIPVDVFPDFLGGIISPPSLRGRSHRDLSPGVGTGFQNKTRSPVVLAYKPDNLKFFDGQHKESLQSFGPALRAFQRTLDSEYCVDRLACRVAAAETTGVIPVWMNMILSGLSEFIPDEKLQSYFKTYNDVIHEIHNGFTDDWVKWCSERYVCNVENITAVTDFNY